MNTGSEPMHPWYLRKQRMITGNVLLFVRGNIAVLVTMKHGRASKGILWFSPSQTQLAGVHL